MTSSPVSLRSAHIRLSLPSRSGDRVATDAELMRLARAIAAAEGWQVDAPTCQVRGEAPREARVAVSGERLPGRCVLRVRERPPGPGTGRTELDARAAAASEHVVDVVAELGAQRVRGREVDAVVLPHPDYGDLGGLLARREGVRSGEAATILLGAAAGLAALHASGWARPELTPSGVVFLGDGCPALDSLDDVEPLTADAAVADAERFYALARTVCLRVVDGSGMQLLGAVEVGLRRGSWSALAEAVLHLIAPEPVALGDAGQRENGRGSTPREPESVMASPRSAPRIRGAGSVAARFGERFVVWGGRAIDLLDGRPGRVLGERLRATLRRRPALLAAAAVPVVAALVLVVLLPVAGEPSSSGKSPGAVVPEGPISASVAHEGTATAEPTSSPAAAAPAPASAVAEASAGEPNDGVGGRASEDPVDAARAVLDARHSCFTARPSRPDCLTDVLDDGSPFVAEEAAALGGQGAAGARDYRGAQLLLVERWGAAALVSAAPDSVLTPKSEPASLLLVRSEAGWRLRAVYP